MVNRRRPGILKAIRREVRSYFTDTTVHGFRYVVEGQNLGEQIFWAVTIVFGFFYAGWIIATSFSSWEETPLQTTVDTVSLPVQELPFPAITICDAESTQMPRQNRWMFVEQLLNRINSTSLNSTLSTIESNTGFDLQFPAIREEIDKALTSQSKLGLDDLEKMWQYERWNEDVGTVVSNFNFLLNEEFEDSCSYENSKSSHEKIELYGSNTWFGACSSFQVRSIVPSGGYSVFMCMYVCVCV